MFTNQSFNSFVFVFVIPNNLFFDFCFLLIVFTTKSIFFLQHIKQRLLKSSIQTRLSFIDGMNTTTDIMQNIENHYSLNINPVTDSSNKTTLVKRKYNTGTVLGEVTNTLVSNTSSQSKMITGKENSQQRKHDTHRKNDRVVFSSPTKVYDENSLRYQRKRLATSPTPWIANSNVRRKLGEGPPKLNLPCIPVVEEQQQQQQQPQHPQATKTRSSVENSSEDGPATSFGSTLQEVELNYQRWLVEQELRRVNELNEFLVLERQFAMEEAAS